MPPHAPHETLPVTIEIEAKMRLDDRPAMQQKLRDMGATHLTDIAESNTYFDTPDDKLKTSDQGLRIRVEDQGPRGIRTVITHKGPRAHGKLKSRSESETIVTSARDAADLLAALGFNPVLSFEKRRQRWELDGCRIELDTMPLLGDFIEIEGPHDDTVMHVRDKLGLAKQPLIKASYIGMLCTHMAEHHMTAGFVGFDDQPATAP